MLLYILTTLFLAFNINPQNTPEGKWKLVYIEHITNDESLQQDQFPFEKDFIVKIQKGRFQYKLVCNSCMAVVEFGKNAELKLSDLGCTEAYCEGETRYNDWLHFEDCNFYDHDATNGKLMISGKEWQYLFELQKEEE